MDRSRPRALDEAIEAICVRYTDGQFTEIVFRASLYAKGLRGTDIDQIVRDTPPPQRSHHVR